MRAYVLQSPSKQACQQEANTLCGARSFPHLALTPSEGHKLQQKQQLGLLPTVS